MVELFFEGQAGVLGRANNMNKGPVVGSMCPEAPGTETEEPNKEPGDELEAVATRALGNDSGNLRWRRSYEEPALLCPG